MLNDKSLATLTDIGKQKKCHLVIDCTWARSIPSGHVGVQDPFPRWVWSRAKLNPVLALGTSAAVHASLHAFDVLPVGTGASAFFVLRLGGAAGIQSRLRKRPLSKEVSTVDQH